MIERILLDSDADVTCIGRKYKCFFNIYTSKSGEYVQQIKMRFMKRVSCPGCEFCGWEEDAIEQDVDNYTPPYIHEPFDGGMYYYAIENMTRDYETGEPDTWDSCFRRIK